MVSDFLDHLLMKIKKTLSIIPVALVTMLDHETYNPDHPSAHHTVLAIHDDEI